MVSMRIAAAAILAAAFGISVAAQDAAQEVRKALEEGNVAARKADKAAYGRFLADDLRSIRGDGGIDGKQERLKGLTTGAPTISDIDAKVVGDVALVVATITATDGTKARAARALVKRDGRWQLALHAQIPMK